MPEPQFTEPQFTDPQEKKKGFWKKTKEALIGTKGAYGLIPKEFLPREFLQPTQLEQTLSGLLTGLAPQMAQQAISTDIPQVPYASQLAYGPMQQGQLQAAPQRQPSFGESLQNLMMQLGPQYAQQFAESPFGQRIGGYLSKVFGPTQQMQQQQQMQKMQEQAEQEQMRQQAIPPALRPPEHAGSPQATFTPQGKIATYKPSGIGGTGRWAHRSWLEETPGNIKAIKAEIGEENYYPGIIADINRISGAKVPPHIRKQRRR